MSYAVLSGKINSFEEKTKPWVSKLKLKLSEKITLTLLFSPWESLNWHIEPDSMSILDGDWDGYDRYRWHGSIKILMDGKIKHTESFWVSNEWGHMYNHEILKVLSDEARKICRMSSKQIINRYIID